MRRTYQVQWSLHSAFCDVAQVSTVKMAEVRRRHGPPPAIHWKGSRGWSGKGWTESSGLRELLGRKRKHLLPGLRFFFFNSSLFIPGWQEYEICIRTCVGIAPDSVSLTKINMLCRCRHFCLQLTNPYFSPFNCPHLSFTKALWSSEHRHCLHFTVWKVRLRETNACSASQGFREEKLNHKCERMLVEGKGSCRYFCSRSGKSL